MSPAGRGSTRPGGTATSPPRPSARRASTPARSGEPRPRAGRPDRRAGAPPRRVLGLRVRTVVALVVLLALALAAVGWFTPLLSVRSVAVEGETVVTEAQVLEALDVAPGTRMAALDLAAAAQRVAALPRVASVRVQRTLPSTVTVTVVERTAVAWVAAPDGQHLLDAAGVDFAVEAPAPGVPQLVVDTPGPADPVTTAALAVLGSLTEPVRVLVGSVGGSSPAAVTLTLLDGRTVLWGGPADAARKAPVLLALLTQPGTTYDVSSPDLPTVR